MQLMSSEELVVEQWEALVGKESSDAYRYNQPGMHQTTHQCANQGGKPPLHPSIASPPDVASVWPQSSVEVQACPSDWREKICEWCYQVIDHCDIDRDVVSITLFYFDRYCAFHTNLDEALYQLVAMTSLYLAVKIHSPRKISVASMVTLSRGHFRMDQVLKMEACIIKTLSWHLNPPTATLCLNTLEPLIDGLSDHADLTFNLKEHARYLIELSVCDDFFIRMRPTSIAYGALLMATHTLNAPRSVQHKLVSHSLDKDPATTRLCADRLRKVYGLAMSQFNDDESRRIDGQSPTSIEQF